jgi:hypothetical protein
MGLSTLFPVRASIASGLKRGMQSSLQTQGLEMLYEELQRQEGGEEPYGISQ